MLTYKVEAGYHTYVSGYAKFPEGRAWEDVKDWYIKWDTLHVRFADAEDYIELSLNSETDECTDWKRPICSSVWGDSGDESYDIELAERS